MDVLVSGKTSFKIEVPYKLVETGPKGPKPLIVYLHGRGQYLDLFEKKTEVFKELDAYHLYLQGPYPELTHIKEREKIGYSWYLYNGKQGSFVKSLEYTAEFIQEIIDGVRPFLKITRLCLVGYSMGGYQAAYFGLSRWKHTNEMIIIGGRIKTELIGSKWEQLRHIKVLALHGLNDTDVSPIKQEEQIAILKKHHIDAEFVGFDHDHSLNAPMLKSGVAWLKKNGY